MHTPRLHPPALILLLLAAAACDPSPARPVQHCPTAPTAAVAAPTVMRATPARGRMGEHLQVWLRLPAQRPDLKDLRLHIDGHSVPGLTASQVGASCTLYDAKRKVAGYLEVHEFVPTRNDASKAAWVHLLGSPTAFVDTILVGAGLGNGPAFRTQPAVDSTKVAFTVVHEPTFWIVGTGLAVLLALLFLMAARTTILRDPPAVEAEQTPSSPPVPDPMPPFSLAKVMMAMWTFIILGGFFLIWLITGEHTGILTPESLLLLGIVGVSAAASTAITRQKNEPLARRDTQLRREEAALHREFRREEAMLHREPDLRAEAAAVRSVQLWRVSDERAAVRARAPGYRGFFTDILSDASGPALHRYQNLAWHLALVVIFITGTYRALAFPALDGTFLALLGISETMYLGLKLNEPRKPNPEQTGDEDTQEGSPPDESV